MSNPGATRWPAGWFVAVTLLAWAVAAGVVISTGRPTPTGGATIGSHAAGDLDSAQPVVPAVARRPAGAPRGLWAASLPEAQVASAPIVACQLCLAPSISPAGPTVPQPTGRGPPGIVVP